MRTITSAKYELPSIDESNNLVKLIRKGFRNPEWVKEVKFVDRELNVVHYFIADSSRSCN